MNKKHTRPAVGTVQVATVVTADLANELRDLARSHERSTAAEIRLALRSWVDQAREEVAA